MILYVLKIIYGNINNVFELDIDNNENLNIFRKIKEKIKENGYWDLGKVLNNKNSGFDFIILPNKDKKNFFWSVWCYFRNKKNYINQDNYDKNLINYFKKLNDIDLLYCVLLNKIFSFYYQNYLFEDNNKIIKWLNEMINKKEMQILNNNQILIQIFQLFINQESYRKKFYLLLILDFFLINNYYAFQFLLDLLSILLSLIIKMDFYIILLIMLIQKIFLIKIKKFLIYI